MNYDTTQDRIDEATAADIRSRLLASPSAQKISASGLKDIAEVIAAETSVPKYPEAQISLLAQKGDAFHLLGAVGNALRAAGADQDTVNAFYDECGRGSYEDLLQTVRSWVSVV